jgi:hypothetical protein
VTAALTTTTTSPTTFSRAALDALDRYRSALIAEQSTEAAYAFARGTRRRAGAVVSVAVGASAPWIAHLALVAIATGALDTLRFGFVRPDGTDVGWVDVSGARTDGRWRLAAEDSFGNRWALDGVADTGLTDILVRLYDQFRLIGREQGLA